MDSFKRINDAFGHPVGDKVLAKVAEICLATLRCTDLFGRIGGEEFAAILTGTDVKGAKVIAERLRRNIQEAAIDTLETITVSLSVSTYGFKYMHDLIPAMAKEMLQLAPIMFGIATVENAYDHVAKIVVAGAAELIETDRQLLIEAKAAMPRIEFSPIDVLVIDEIGKDVSGDGMDPNITGRYPTPYPTGGPEVSKMVVLDLTEKTGGNANGVGTADFTTKRLVNKTDFQALYANGITSTVVRPNAIPMTLDCDLDAIRAAVKTSNALDLSKIRLVRIKNTLQLGEIMISEAMLPDALSLANVAVCSEPFEMQFDDLGNLRKG